VTRSIEDLLAEIERTDDRATYVVLADALVEAGDPRGDLMAVQLALDDQDELPSSLRALARPDLSDRSDALDRATVKSLRRRALGLRKARIQALLGPFADSTEIALGFRYGLLDHVRLEASGVLPIAPRRPGAPSVASVLADIFASPEARMLRTVEVFPHDEPSAGEIRRFVDAIRNSEARPPSSLRSLRLGDTSDAREYQVRLRGLEDYTDDVTTLLDVFPHLHELWLDLGTTELELAPFASTDLRHLTLITPYARPELVQALAASVLPALRSLVVWTGATYYVEGVEELVDDYPGHGPSVDDLEPLFAMLDGCAGFDHLGICNHAGDLDELVERIVNHAFARRLTTLDLSFADAIPETARATLATLPALRTLITDDVGASTRYRFVVSQE
jgi:hypothetical protein